MARNYKQGTYVVKNPDKYMGVSKECTWRSSWELEVMKFFDRNPKVVEWGSEPFAIEYFDVSRDKKRRYFPDFYVKYIDKEGELVSEVIEVKPIDQVKPPKKGGKPKTYMEAVVTYNTNISKWNAAHTFCEQRGWRFRIITENSIFK